MGDLQSFPRAELLARLGFAPEPEPAKPRRKGTTKPEQPLPDLSMLPPARGVGRPNRTAKLAARKEFEERQAARAERTRQKAEPGRAVPRRAPNVHRAIHQTQDAE